MTIYEIFMHVHCSLTYITIYEIGTFNIFQMNYPYTKRMSFIFWHILLHRNGIHVSYISNIFDIYEMS